MTYALGEVEALCRKAARGAGFSWGMADEAGKVARWLCRQGLPGAAALSGYLNDKTQAVAPEDPEALDWSAGGPLCPLVCGALLSDLGAGSQERRFHSLAAPILLLPQMGRGVTLSWEGTQICKGDVLRLNGDPLTPLALRVTLAVESLAMGDPCTPTTRAAIAPEDLNTLTRLAARTYAPETDASKLSGAGAGLRDED